MQRVVWLLLVLLIAAGAAVTARHTTEGGGAERYRYYRVEHGLARIGEDADWRGRPKLEVSWKLGDSERWSPATQALVVGRDWSISYAVRVSQDTVAIMVTSVPWPIDDEEPSTPNRAERPRRALAVCTPSGCTGGQEWVLRRQLPRREGVTSARGRPQLTADGDRALIPLSPGELALWDGQSISRQRVPVSDGLRVSDVLLTPAGQLRVLAGARTESGCRVTLLTGDFPAAGEALTLRESLDLGDRPGRWCPGTIDSFAEDYVVIDGETDHPAFARLVGSAWRRVDDDPSGRMRFVPREGRVAKGQVIRDGFWHWREAVVGSPDGRRMYVQFHYPGEPKWRTPTQVGTAPPGWDCFEIGGTPNVADDPFYVSLRCRRGGPSGTYRALNAMTEDGETWHSLWGTDLPRVRFNSIDQMVFPGDPSSGTVDHEWTAAEGWHPL